MMLARSLALPVWSGLVWSGKRPSLGLRPSSLSLTHSLTPVCLAHPVLSLASTLLPSPPPPLSTTHTPPRPALYLTYTFRRSGTPGPKPCIAQGFSLLPGFSERSPPTNDPVPESSLQGLDYIQNGQPPHTRDPFALLCSALPKPTPLTSTNTISSSS
ncbi:hypothetical protein LY76DRAFT_411216 [Colletotrichum caudatum]|nr:hypothetical protein LY76DRAFT_411216 [Colletotrichum caudatum]